MSSAPPFPTLTGALSSQVSGIHWLAVVGTRDTTVLSLLFQLAHNQ